MITPLPSCSIRCIALCNCSPHSQRMEPKISPVAQEECTRTKIGSSGSNLPFIRAICSSPLLFWRKGIKRKWPYWVGRSTSTPFSTIDSVFKRYEIRSLIQMILISNFLATSISWGRRAMVPSSLMISISAPAGYKPARRARSTAASVCPARRNTPRERARSGLICPGRPRSDGLVFGSASARIVSARSNIETPVVQPPPNLSTVIVKGVPSKEVLFATCMSSSNS